MATMLEELPTLPARHASRPTATRSAVILDSRPLLLEMLERLLETIEIATVCKATTADEALRAVRTHRPEVFLLDLHASEGEEGQTIRDARCAVPEIVPIVLVSPSEGRQVAAAFAAGAAAAVTRTARPEDVALAVRQALSPTIFLANPLLQAAAPVLAADGSGAGELTKREREILLLVAEGLSNGRVARTLWVTEQTVKFHLSNVYRKLDVANRTEASRWAHRNGLVAAQSALEPACA